MVKLGKKLFRIVGVVAGATVAGPFGVAAGLALGNVIDKKASHKKIKTKTSSVPAQLPTDISTTIDVDAVQGTGLTAADIDELQNVPDEVKAYLQLGLDLHFAADRQEEFRIQNDLAELLVYVVKTRGRTVIDDGGEQDVVDFAMVEAKASSPVAAAQLVLKTTTTKRAVFGAVKVSSKTRARAQSLGFTCEQTAAIADLLRQYLEVNERFILARNNLAIVAP